jgi:site-specific recombinase XerC
MSCDIRPFNSVRWGSLLDDCIPKSGVITCIDAIITDFLVYLSANSRSNRTIEVYKQRLKVLGELGEVEAITARQVDELIARLRASGIARATLAGYIQAIKTLFSWGVKRNYLQSNPAKGLYKPRLSYRVDSKAIDQGDLDQMIEYARENKLNLEYTLLVFLADTGCRAGELRNLNLSDINLTKLEALARGKTGERYLDFTDVTGEALRAWLEVRPDTDHDALFTIRHGRISHKRLYILLRAIARELGIRRFNPHSIRHRVGQGWIDAGANLELVRQKLGHKNISTTAMIYGNQDRQRIKAASRRYSLVKGR